MKFVTFMGQNDHTFSVNPEHIMYMFKDHGKIVIVLDNDKRIVTRQFKTLQEAIEKFTSGGKDD